MRARNLETFNKRRASIQTVMRLALRSGRSIIGCVVKSDESPEWIQAEVACSNDVNLPELCNYESTAWNFSILA